MSNNPSNPVLTNKFLWPTYNLSNDIDIQTPSLPITFKDRVNNYFNKYSSNKYNLINSAISGGADLAGNLINSSGLSSTAGNIMSGVGNIVGNIPGPIGWAGKGLALAGQAVNALWGHKFNDANVAAAESANRERNNWQFGDYSNTDALLAGSMANVQLGNVSKGFLGKEGPFSNAVTNKTNQINNDRMQANLRANNSELNAYNNYQTGMVRNAIAGDSMGNVNAAASGGPLNMISGAMTPFGNRYFADGGYTHGSLFNNGFIEINNGGSHEQNPYQGVQYGVDPQGTPNMVEEGETILDDYVFSDRIKFPKKYKDEFALGGKIWKKTFADVSKMIAKESEERPNDPISQRSLKAMGGKLADIQEEVKAKQALDKMDPREVMAMLQQLAMMQQGEQPQMEEQQMMQDPYQQAMMMGQGVEEPMIAANGGGIHIKPSKRGTFTAAATKHGMGVQEFASQVLANPNNYSTAMVKKANFARNAAKWHACGGRIRRFDSGGDTTIPIWMRYIPIRPAIQPQIEIALDSYNNGNSFNLFKTGGKSTSKYKSDNDWEQMYELSVPVYNKFVKAGIPPMVALGVISNIALESSFNHKAFNKTHWGYVQNDKTLRDYIVSKYGGYGPDEQLQFLIDGLTKGIKGSDKGVGKQIQARFNGYKKAMKGIKDPEQAAALWEKHYEISGGQGMYDRKNYAKKFNTRYKIVSQAEDGQQYSNDEYISNYVPEELNQYAQNFQPTGDFAIPNSEVYADLSAARDGAGKNKVKQDTQAPDNQTTLNGKLEDYGFLKDPHEILGFNNAIQNTNFGDKKSIARLLKFYVDNDVFAPQFAARLFDNILHNKFPGKEKGSSEGWIENLLKADINGTTIEEKDKNGKAVKKTIPWVGKDYWSAIQNESNNNFSLNRGFDGKYSKLAFDFNEDTTKDALSQYLSEYGDINYRDTYLNEYNKNQKELYRDRYNKLKAFEDKYSNFDYFNTLSQNTNDSQQPITGLQRRLDTSYSDAENASGNKKQKLFDDIQDFMDSNIYNSSLLSDPDFLEYLEADRNGLNYSNIKALDPDSEEFKQLTPEQQEIAEGKWLQENFNNNKEWQSHKEIFDKEVELEEEKRKRDEAIRNSLKYTALPTWMRYAPLAFSSVATLTDALGLTNKPDLTPYNQLIAQSDRFNKTPIVRSHPVFQPMQYQPINLNYDLGQANNLYANTSRAINNTASGNIGAAIAGNLAALNNAGSNYARIRQAINEQNIANQKNVMDYNNKGAYQDAMASLEAQKINSANQQNAQRFSYQALADALRYYQAEQQAANAAKQINLTHAVNSWANVGRENMYINMINNNKAIDYGIGPNGDQWYKWLNPITNA